MLLDALHRALNIYQSQWTPARIQQVRALAAQGISQSNAARMLGSTRGAIAHIASRHQIRFHAGRGGCVRKEFAPRICGNCRQLFYRRDDEASTDFHHRKFCSKACFVIKANLGVPWTEERVAQLRELAAAGHSARQIGNVLGVSRNAVVGISKRKGIILSGSSATKYTPSPHSPRRARPERKVFVSNSVLVSGKAPVVVDDHIPIEQQVTFERLAPHHCRWPIGDLPDMKFCGGQRHGKSSYCEEHEARSRSYVNEQRKHGTPLQG